MIAARRLDWNPALERAVEWCREIDRPLLIFEGLRCDYRWASHRLHRFCIDGMAAHRRRLEGSRVGYFPWLEREPGEGRGLLAALGEEAAVVITDEFPSFFLPRMVRAAANRLPVALEVVDGNGILPLREPDRDFVTAHSFRRHLQKVLPRELEYAPAPHPLRGDPLPPFAELPEGVRSRWPPAEEALLDGEAGTLDALPIDPTVPPVPFAGTSEEARRRLTHFLEGGLGAYADGRNDPDGPGTSGLSPFLHWGRISAHEVVHTVLEREEWHPGRLAGTADGRRRGWWGLDAGSEAFLDQLVTWRELGYVTAHRTDDSEAYESLPSWARETLAHHADDPRPHLYTLEAFEKAETHDELWNAAQRELREEGTIHNYLRMLWGKKILHWTESPEMALDIMLELNNRWAIDGRNPNSTSGIFWVLGRYDRGWPEREVFGKVRSMTSRSTRRKLNLAGYLNRFGPDGPQGSLDL